MNRQDRYREFQDKTAHGASRRKEYIHPRSSEQQAENGKAWQSSPSEKDLDHSVSIDQANFAYQLLLLQQRLAAYEQLHLEEIAELRHEIERLRRAFLQETSPDLRAISPARGIE